LRGTPEQEKSEKAIKRKSALEATVRILRRSGIALFLISLEVVMSQGLLEAIGLILFWRLCSLVWVEKLILWVRLSAIFGPRHRFSRRLSLSDVRPSHGEGENPTFLWYD
jgi:hypothetical protein